MTFLFFFIWSVRYRIRTEITPTEEERSSCLQLKHARPNHMRHSVMSDNKSPAAELSVLLLTGAEPVSPGLARNL